MKEFILRSLKAKTSPFDINDLKNAGRLDLVCNCITNALFIAGDLRRDAKIHVVLEGPNNPPKTISFDGNKLKGIEDEKSIAIKINEALIKSSGLTLNEELDINPGISIAKKSFEQLVKDKSKSNQLIYLHKEGKDIRKTPLEENSIFIFGDYIGMPRKTEKLLDRLKAQRISLSPIMLFSSQCIAIVHNELDRRSIKL